MAGSISNEESDRIMAEPLAPRRPPDRLHVPREVAEARELRRVDEAPRVKDGVDVRRAPEDGRRAGQVARNDLLREVAGRVLVLRGDGELKAAEEVDGAVEPCVAAAGRAAAAAPERDGVRAQLRPQRREEA